MREERLPVEKEIYLEKYCKKHEVSREEALTHSTIRNAMEYYDEVIKRAEGRIAASEDK